MKGFGKKDNEQGAGMQGTAQGADAQGVGAQAELDKMQSALMELTGDLQRTRADFENYRKQIEAQKENIALQEARIIGLMEKLGIANPEDMTEKERFLELEREKDAFDRYFERNWGVAKRKIRRKILWRKKD